MKALKLSLAALALWPALVLADPVTADDWYKEGEKQYTLQNFDKAADAFKKGYELEENDAKKAAYLFNVAQSYRQKGNDCKNAQHYYKRYLAQRDSNTAKPLSPLKRKETEDLIASLDACVKQQEATRIKPPETNLNPGREDDKTPVKPVKKVGVVEEVPEEEEEEEDGITKSTPTGQPKLLSARFVGGGSKVSAGELDIPIQATFALIAGYPLRINEKLTLELGAGFTFTPVPYQRNGESTQGKLVSTVANAGASYEVMPKLNVRGDLGIGALFFSNVSASVFTMEQPTTGTLGMFHVRTALSVDYAFTPNLLATATPIAFSYSPAKAGLREDITAITQVNFMLGLGYRM